MFESGRSMNSKPVVLKVDKLFDAAADQAHGQGVE